MNIQEWQEDKALYEEIILYCDNYVLDGQKLFRDEFEVERMRSTWGEPTPRLRQFAKDKLKEAFLRYWETI